ncbi:hypothetical protein OXX79_010131 [Metschnikowia pulcherrima]
MLKSRLLYTNAFVRYASQEGKKRFMRTVPAPSKRSPAADFGRLDREIPADLPNNAITGRSWAKHSLNSQLFTEPQQAKSQTQTPSRWAKHSIDAPSSTSVSNKNSESLSQGPEEVTLLAPVRRSRTSRFRSTKSTKTAADTEKIVNEEKSVSPELPKVIIEPTANETVKPVSVQEGSSTSTAKAKKPRRQLKPRKALITLTPNALENLRGLLDQPEPQLIRIGVKNRGCSGLTYHLEYVTEPGKFDEIVEQDGVKVVIDSKALFSIVGSEMDWIDDKLSSRFIFRNPNSKGTCGCGESFMV